EALDAPFEPMGSDGGDLMMQRLLGEQFVIEEVLFLSALRLARIVAAARGRRQTVYMIGFDFQPDAGVARAVGRDYAPGNSADRFFRVGFQEFFFLNALYMLKESELDVIHVGNRSFSRIDGEALNRRFGARPRD